MKRYGRYLKNIQNELLEMKTSVFKMKNSQHGFNDRLIIKKKRLMNLKR